ncbi:MAG TPA: glucose-6-phosphate isomerase [bacterium]|nr:glucose-6-phosphate isomerase [bacterium]
MPLEFGFSAPSADDAAVNERLDTLTRERFVERLWAGNATLWTRDPAGQAAVRDGLGWLRAPQVMTAALDDLRGVAAAAEQAGYRQVLHMGMGGSSLAPLVFARTFPPADRRPATMKLDQAGGLRLSVLDTTDPATILAEDRWAAGAPTLFIVASKSGTTAEPLAFGEYFYAKRRDAAGERAGEDFLAITDAGTPLAKQANERHYRRVFTNAADVGGRYSALTYFGLVPAVLAGVDVARLLERARGMAEACGPWNPPGRNPGTRLGAIMGELARRGRDKVTFVVSEPVATLGTWLEQLLAESTGKQGTGLLPVADEPLGEAGAYGADRLFVHLRRRGDTGGPIEDRLRALRSAGHPVVTVEMSDTLDIAAEFFRWEIATATAGAILGINAFDQPNVQESKDNTNRLLDVVRRERRLPEPAPSQADGALALYADAPEANVAATLARFFGAGRPGGYVALLAYLTETPETHRRLTAIRARLRDTTRLASTLGYGPRYLHSTGQYHKGGPSNGLFLLITADETEDAAVPGQPYTFGVFKRAQALGDLEALHRHGQRAVRVHLRGPVDAALDRLEHLTAAALAAVGFPAT